MSMRLTGLMSGMDTESIIQELVSVKRTKVDDTKKAQTKHKWKQEAWKELNSQVLKLYNGALGNMRFESSYMKKTTKVSNPNVASVITGEGAMNSVQSLQITNLAKSAYMTGGELESPEDVYKSSTKVVDILKDSGLTTGEGADLGKISLTVGGETKSIEITESTTISSFVTDLRKAGVNASFDEKNQRFFVSSKSTGKKQNFTLLGADVNGCKALQALGLSTYSKAEQDYYTNLSANPDQVVANRIADEEARLIEERKTLLEEQSSQLKQLDTYSVLFKDIDTTKPLSDEDFQKVKEKIEEFKDSDTAAEKTAYKELKDWASDYEKTSKEIDDLVNNKLEEVGTDDEGNVIYQMTDSYKTTFKEQVEAEIAVASEIAAAYADGTLKATAENKIDGEDAVISLNDVEFTSDSNSFEINGLTITVNAETAKNEVVTITTEDDTDGIYDMVKNFFKEYNTIINQMDKLYNADSASDYQPLTDEEKEQMSESAVEEWEKKIKDALLRKDSTLSTVSSAMKEIMMSGISVNGKQMHLSDFGIETLSYFTAPENEKNAYHIAGDPDDANTSGNADKLKSMIASDPETVVSFFSSLSKNLYSKLSDLMKGTEYSSSYTLYDDKKMKEDYNDYTTKIAELEQKLNDYEDKWYAKFAAMETAMAKMQSDASAVTSLLGG